MLDFDLMQRELYTGVVCDVLDGLGYRNQAMEPDVRPLQPDTVLVGSARTVLSGDIIFGDVDGVVVIPRDVAEQTVAEALEKVKQENASRVALERGAYLRDVYARYGVL